MESADIKIRSHKIGDQCPLKVAFEFQGADGYHHISVSLQSAAFFIDKAIKSIIALGRLYRWPQLFASFRLMQPSEREFLVLLVAVGGLELFLHVSYYAD
jgi:hypothetical protein